MKVHIFHTGRVRVDVSIPYGERNPLAPLGIFRKHKKIILPVSCYLIMYKTYKILIDTGWHSAYIHHKSSRFFGLENRVSRPIIGENEAIDCKLETLNIKPRDLDYVILTHLDLYHASGLLLVKNAKHILVSKDEFTHAQRNPIRYNSNHWKGVALQTFDFEHRGIGPVGKSYNLFDDENIMLISTPGHSYGHTSIMLKNGEKYLIIAGDCVYTRKSWEENKLPGIIVDGHLARQSLEWIKQAHNDKHCVAILANHDFEVSEGVIEL